MRKVSKIEISGEFWIAKQPECKRSGILYIDEDGCANLEVIGGFDTVDEVTDFDIILGVCESLQYVTLQDCFYTHQPLIRTGSERFKIFSNFVYFGFCADSMEGVQFESLHFSMDNLTQWIGQRLVDVIHDEDFDGGSIKFGKRKTWRVPIEGYEVEISTGCGVGQKSNPRRTTVDQYSWFSIYASSPKNLNELVSIASLIRDFIYFSIGAEVQVRNVSANISIPSIQENFSSEDDFIYSRENIDVHLPFSDPKIKEQPINSADMLFLLKDIEDDVEVVLNSWIEYHKRSNPAVQLYLGAANGSSNFVDYRLLMLTHAMEASYSGLGLKKRGNFTEKAQRVVCVADKYFGVDGLSEKIVKNLKHTRNFLTHHSDEDQNRALKGADMIELYRIVEVVFAVFLMVESKISQSCIMRILSENRELKWKSRGLAKIK